MKICNLASGSRGNCTYLSGGGTSVLIDNGLMLRDFERRASARGICAEKLSAILVTHEHSDHIKGVDALSRRYGIPVYVHEKSRCALGGTPYAENLPDTEFAVGGLSFRPFRLPHDSAYNLGFRVTDGKKTVALATDLGYMSEATLSALVGADVVMLESNHDLEMLYRGSYPYTLKRRIAGRNGHLSNDDCASAAVTLADGGTSVLMLAHLSRDNNTPESAFECTKAALERNRIREGRDVRVEVASQFAPTGVIEV